MSLLDFLKAAGVALLVMVLNVAIAFAVVFAYSIFVAPGHDEAFYQAAALRIAPWSSVVAGIPLFFGAAYFFAKRRPSRNRYAFAATFTGIYAAVDIAAVLGEAGAGGLMPIVALSMVTKLAAALFGAKVAA